MRTLSLFLPALLLIAQLVYAEDVGPGLVEYGGYLPPEEVTSYIEARIENHGNYRVFVALPGGWSLNTSEYNVKSYAVREFGLWRIYDEEMLKRGKVYTTKGLSPKGAITVQIIGGDTYTGWYLKPNEGLIIKVKTAPISGEGVVDPLKIEKQYPGVKVLYWYQGFTLKMPSRTYGWVRAPWVVKGATLVEAYPAPYGEASKTIMTGKSFWGVEGPKDEYLELSVDVPSWNEWLPIKNSLAYALLPKSLAKLRIEFMDVEPLGYVRPVWDTQKHRTDEIYYAYEWERGKEIRGITLFRDDVREIPSWMELF